MILLEILEMTEAEYEAQMQELQNQLDALGNRSFWLRGLENDDMGLGLDTTLQ